MNTILSHVFRNLTLIFIDLERKSIFGAERGSKDFRNMYLDHVLSKSRSECEQVVNIIHDAEKEYTNRENNTFAWDGVRAATVRAEASRRWFCPYDALPAVAITPPPRQLPSPTVEDYPGPHLDGSPSNPPELPSSSVQFLRFSLFSSPLSPPLSPLTFFTPSFFHFFSFSLLWFVISSILVFYSSARSYPFLSFVVLSSSSLSSFRLKFPGPSILFAFLSTSPLLSPASPYSPLSPCVYLYLLFSFSFPPDVVSFLSFSSDPSSPHSVSLLRYNSTPTSLVRELVFPYTPLFLAVPLSVRGCV